MITFFRNSLVTVLSLSLAFFPIAPEVVAATTVKIRQEINIIDGYLGSASGVYATSSAIIEIDTNDFTDAQYYFEVLASTTSAVSSSIFLKSATSSATIATITYSNSNTYTLYRTAFTPTPGANEYKVVTSNSAVQKGIKAARIVILQNGTSIGKTQTQIEIGNEETYTFTAATSTFSSPKYWNYDSSNWDGSATFYAEVTYNTIRGVASSTAYAAAGTYTVNLPTGTASTSVGLWGGGGAGGSATSNPGGGSGGAGGQFASSTLVATTSAYTLIVGAGAPAPAATAAGTQGASSTWSGGLVVAGGGAGGGLNAAGTTTGHSNGCIGQICFAGGNGGNGRNATTQYGGGGGGGAGTSGAGGSSTGAGVAGTGTVTSGGNGAAKNTTAGSAGTTGSAGGGGGSGGNASNATDRAGGAGGIGRAYITTLIATTSITLEVADGTGDGFVNWSTAAVLVALSDEAGQPTRFRSSSFVPVSGRNYRIAFKAYDNRTLFAIYNAKIIVDQTSPTKLEAQYLQANTKLAAGTGLQNFLTLWDSNEWNTTNTYIHQVSAANGSASVVELATAGGTQITGSVVTSPDNRGVSSGMTMPAVGNIDVRATTNNSDIYDSRILVRVTAPATPSEGTGSAIRSGVNMLNTRIKFLGGRFIFR